MKKWSSLSETVVSTNGFDVNDIVLRNHNLVNVIVDVAAARRRGLDLIHSALNISNTGGSR